MYDKHTHQHIHIYGDPAVTAALNRIADGIECLVGQGETDEATQARIAALTNRLKPSTDKLQAAVTAATPSP